WAPDRAGEETAAKRAIGDEADAEPAAGLQHSVLWIARPERILGLHGGDGMHLVRARDGLGRCFTQADVANFSGAHQFRHGANRLLDGRVGVDAVLVVEIDVLDAEALQAALDGLPNVLGAAVEAARSGIGWIAHDAEFRGEEDSVTLAFD